VSRGRQQCAASRVASAAVEWKLCQAILQSSLLRRQDRAKRYTRVYIRFSAVTIISTKTKRMREIGWLLYAASYLSIPIPVLYIYTWRGRSLVALLSIFKRYFSFLYSLILRACVRLTHTRARHAFDTETNGEADAFFYRSLHLAFSQSAAKRHCERTTHPSSFTPRSSSSQLRRVMVYIFCDLQESRFSGIVETRNSIIESGHE